MSVKLVRLPKPVPPQFLEGFYALDNSMASTKQTCDRKFFFRHVMHLTPKIEAKPLRAGRAWHEAMRVGYTLMQAGAADTEIREKSEEALVKEAVAEGSPLEIYAEDDPKRSLERLMLILGGYWDKNLATDRVRWQVIDVEVGFALVIDEVIIWVGRIDLVVREEGRLLGVDHKTASSIRSDYFHNLRPNNAFTGYILGIKSLMGECHGLIESVALLAKIKMDFPRAETNRTPAEFEEFLLERRAVGREIVQRVKHHAENGSELHEWPKNAPLACVMYNGCAFRDLCNSHASSVVVADSYKLEIWEPYDIYGEKED